MNGIPPTQFHIDFRTGRETGIPGARLSAGDRTACSALNRQRAKGIEEATRQTPSRESFSADVWAALVAARARDWTVPLIRFSSRQLTGASVAIMERECFVCIASRIEISPESFFSDGAENETIVTAWNPIITLLKCSRKSAVPAVFRNLN